MRKVIEYIPLARNLAKRYTPKGQHFEDSDCMSVAYEALSAGAARLDDRDEGCSTYLQKTIEGALKRHLTTQRVQGFSGLKRSKYAEAILMDKDTDIPEELEGPLDAALNTLLCIDEPIHIGDDQAGTLKEVIDLGVPSVEDECIMMETQVYLERGVEDWKSRFSELEGQYITEVMMGDKTQTQFCKDNKIGDRTAKKMQDRIIEEGQESLSYLLYNLGETP
jgi:hypothetical protein